MKNQIYKYFKNINEYWTLRIYIEIRIKLLAASFVIKWDMEYSTC